MIHLRKSVYGIKERMFNLLANVAQLQKTLVYCIVAPQKKFINMNGLVHVYNKIFHP